MSGPGCEPEGRPETGFGIRKSRIVIGTVQYIRMLLQQFPHTFDITLLADVAEFLDFSEARIRLRDHEHLPLTVHPRAWLIRKTCPSGWRTCISRTFQGISVGGQVTSSPCDIQC